MDKKLSELICTRISHDLIGNIGAVANAAELLEEENDIAEVKEVLPILKIGSGVLVARLRFFRMLFGLHSPNIEDMAVVKQTTAAYLATTGGKQPPALNFALETPRYAVAAMAAVMALADLMRGGSINVVEQGGKVSVSVSGDVKLGDSKVEQFVSVLKSTAVEISAQDVPLLYLLDVCRNCGIKLSFGSNPMLRLVLE